MERRKLITSLVTVNGEKAVCRKFLAIMVGLFEADSIKETFGASMCELDCEDCVYNKSKVLE